MMRRMQAAAASAAARPPAGAPASPPASFDGVMISASSWIHSPHAPPQAGPASAAKEALDLGHDA